MANTGRSFLTVKQTVIRYPAFNERGLRWVIFNKERNGFDRVIRRIGRKVLIDEAAFIKWIDQG